MSWLLNATYVCFLVLASPWLLWRYFVQHKNRRGWSQKLLGLVTPRDSQTPCIWIHAVSVGEVNLLTPVLKRLREVTPDVEFAISTTTETGFDLARKKFPDCYVFFCPLDFTWAIKRVLVRLRPDLLALAELELWPNLIQTTRESGIPVAVINGRLSANSFKGYRRLSWIVGPSFKRLSLVAAQNKTYADRFTALGCNPSHVVVTGSVKFDGVETNRANPQTQQLGRLAEIGEEELVFVAGSTQVEEDLMAARIYQQMHQTTPNMRLVLVPRHPDRCGLLVSKLKQLEIPTVLRSSLKSDGAATFRTSSGSKIKPVLIVDVIGELGAWWGCADAAFVGGSMGTRGGQNMIEPAAYGVPLSFGPNTENFRDIVDELLTHDAATVIHDADGLRTFFELAFSRPDWAKGMGHRSSKVVLAHVGASQRTVECLKNLLEKTTRLGGSESVAGRAA